MTGQEHFVEITEAVETIRGRLSAAKSFLSISSTTPKPGDGKVVMYWVKVGRLKFTDAERGVVNQEVEIYLQLENAINERGYIYSCGFYANTSTIKALIEYAPTESPLRDLDYYPDREHWYTESSLEKVLKNHYVVDYDKDTDYGTFSLYGDLQKNCDAVAMAEFIFCVIKNIPGFEILNDPDITVTEREQIILARVGQGKYRADLMAKWGGQCSVLGIEVGEVLRASHVKPWKMSTTNEKLDPQNGLLLTAHLDALFDRHLISFNDDGSLLVSKKIAEQLRGILDPNCRIRSGSELLTQDLRRYLSDHRREFEKKKLTAAA